MSTAFISDFAFPPVFPSVEPPAWPALDPSLISLSLCVFALLPIFAFNTSPSTFISSTFISSSSFPLYG